MTIRDKVHGNIMKGKGALRVKYKRGTKVVGNTSTSHVDNNPSYLTSFDDGTSASAFVGEFNNETIPNFGNVIWLLEDGLAVLVEEGYEVFDPNKQWEFHIWHYDSKQTKIICMSYYFVKLFQGVIKVLQVLHSHNWYHGRLLEGITVSSNLDVKLFNISKRDWSIERGIEKDLDDLRALVDMVVNKNPHGQDYETPDCVTLFRNFFGMFSTIKLDVSIKVEKWKFSAYFTYLNPIFAGPNDQIALIRKFINLRKLFEDEVDKAFALQDFSIAIGKWWLRVDPSSYLYKRMERDMHRYIAPWHSGDTHPSIIMFYRGCFRHKTEGKAQGHNIDDVVIQSELLETFPDCLPKVYYAFIRFLAWKEIPPNPWFNSYIEFFEKSPAGYAA